MIVRSEQLENGLRAELVDGEDIVESYGNDRYVSSCMSPYYENTILYTYIKGLKLFRIMRGDDLVLRSLLWKVRDEGEGKTFTLFDGVYTNSYYDNDADRSYFNKINLNTLFTELWPKWGDARRSARTLFVDLKRGYPETWPYMDTFRYISPCRRKLCNAGLDGYDNIFDVMYVEYD